MIQSVLQSFRCLFSKKLQIFLILNIISTNSYRIPQKCRNIGEDFKQYFLLQKTFILASLTSYWRKTPINRLLYTCRRLRAPTNAVIFFWSKMFFVNIAETKGFLSKENIDVSTFLKPISQEKPFIFNYKFNLNQKKKRRKWSISPSKRTIIYEN